MNILSLFFKPKTKAPEQKLRETRAMLRSWIIEAEKEVAISTDELWNMGEMDNIVRWQAQIGLVNELLDKSERCTASGLENLLREKFRAYDGLDASLAALPCFDDDEDELDWDAMTSTERIQRKAEKHYHERQFVIQHQIELLGRFAGVSARRIHDVIHIMYAHYVPVEDRPAMKNEKAASWYPAIRTWMDDEEFGSIKDLAIPAEFSGWMPEHESMFPVLV